MAPASMDACMPGSTERSSNNTDSFIPTNVSFSVRPSSSVEGIDEHQCTWYVEAGGPFGELVKKKTNPSQKNTMLRFGNRWYENVPADARSPTPCTSGGNGSAPAIEISPCNRMSIRECPLRSS